ncbi:S-methylmethionine--homocysteine S-methyltransferase BHMT2 isoform X5 [Vulpes vulpes]|uniref:S-methylmethionine--homocysteine S-methyltransferase BHMT2 isoform X5 n=1 Tax=Vulpes vulpes TaxID=9627 RepID=A0ABM4YRY5_VULVU
MARLNLGEEPAPCTCRPGHLPRAPAAAGGRPQGGAPPGSGPARGRLGAGSGRARGRRARRPGPTGRRAMAPVGGPGAKKGILERLDSGEVVVGDGSFLITLEKRGYVKAGLWTPEAIVDHPDAVRQLHMEFLRAGSNVMQTFTFSASEDNMGSKWEDVNAAACDLAREVAGKGDALVAGGISQTSMYKHHKDEARVKKLFQLQLEVFIRKNVDFLIAEEPLCGPSLPFLQNLSQGGRTQGDFSWPFLSYLLKVSFSIVALKGVPGKTPANDLGLPNRVSCPPSTKKLSSYSSLL